MIAPIQYPMSATVASGSLCQCAARLSPQSPVDANVTAALSGYHRKSRRCLHCASSMRSSDSIRTASRCGDAGQLKRGGVRISSRGRKQGAGSRMIIDCSFRSGDDSGGGDDMGSSGTNGGGRHPASPELQRTRSHDPLSLSRFSERRQGRPRSGRRVGVRSHPDISADGTRIGVASVWSCPRPARPQFNARPGRIR